MPAEAQALADARALLGPGAHPLDHGATCRVFTDGRRVARLARSPEARLLVQSQVQRRLAAQGVPVPPILCVGTLRAQQPYIVDILMTGDGQGPSAAGWADLGVALRALHTLPHTGYGLLVDRADALCGQATDPEAGLRSRLPEVWPFGPVPLAQQPLVWADAGLLTPLLHLEADLQQVAQRAAAVCHTDLHGGQLVWRGGRLVALLDFGDAAAVPPAWDLASAASFHGWVATEQVAGAAGLSCGQDAALLGLLLAQHRAQRALQPGQVAAAVAFAHTCLHRLGQNRPTRFSRPGRSDRAALGT